MARRNQKPLVIMIHPDLFELKSVVELIEKGHDVQMMPSAAIAADVILGKNCWRMTPELANATATMFDNPIKATRAIKYKKKEEEIDL